MDTYDDTSLTREDTTGFNEVGALFLDSAAAHQAVAALVAAGFPEQDVSVGMRETATVIGVFTNGRFDEARDILVQNGGELGPVDLRDTVPAETV
ncbi:hypothetical protein BH11ARM2_BH11ARM2_28160 [soil metagenome]